MNSNLFYLIFKTLRPRQWTKNVFIIAPLIFSQNFSDTALIIKTAIAFFVFCIISGCVYTLNDLIDLEQDKRHPVKSKRPLASGRLKPKTAVAALIILLAAALGLAFVYLNSAFLITALLYLVLQIAYSSLLKHIVIIDVFCIATGFLLRVIAGAEVIEVNISTWLLICTILLSLFLALSKRRHEIILLEDNAIHHRKILFEYSTYLLDQMISIVTTSTVIAYILYTISDDTIQKFGSDKLKYTVPFVLYGIFRYLYLIHQKNEGGSPDRVLLMDKPLMSAVILYGVTACIILYI